MSLSTLIFVLFATCIIAHKDCDCEVEKDKPAVCFVGVGTSSLIWAQLLCDEIKSTSPSSSCDNIYMFEAENDASYSSAKQEITDFEETLQFGAMLYPYQGFQCSSNDTFYDEGTYKPMDDLMSKYDLEYQTWQPFWSYTGDMDPLTPLQDAAATVLYAVTQNDPVEFQLLVGETVKLITFAEMINCQTNTMQDIYKSGIVNKGETFSSWCSRNDLTRIGLAMAKFADGGGGLGPTQNQPAILVLKIISNYFFNLMARVLKIAGLQYNDDFMAAASPLIVTLLKNDNNSKRNGAPKSYVSVKNGIQRLWNAMAKELATNGANIYFNEQVISLNKMDNQKTRIQSIKERTMECDMTILSSRPAHLVEYIDAEEFSEAYNLYNALLAEDSYYNKQIYFEIGIQLPADAVPLWLQSDAITHPTMITFARQVMTHYGGSDPSPFYCKPSLVYTMNDATTITVTAYQNEDIFNEQFTKQDCFDNIIAYLRDVGFHFTMDNILKQKGFIYPSVVPPELEENGWYEQLDALQGENGVYYIGAIVSGGWILNVWDHQIATFPPLYNEYQTIWNYKKAPKAPKQPKAAQSESNYDGL